MNEWENISNYKKYYIICSVCDRYGFQYSIEDNYVVEVVDVPVSNGYVQMNLCKGCRKNLKKFPEMFNNYAEKLYLELSKEE